MKPYSCKYCDHRFTSPQGVSQHIRKYCKVANNPEELRHLYERTLKQQTQIANHAAELEIRLEERATRQIIPSQQVQRVQGNSYGATFNTGPVTNNLIINSFGHEDRSHISKEKVKALLDETLSIQSDPSSAALTALFKMASLIYSDPGHPENLTCYIPNKKHANVMVHRETGWQVEPLNLVLPPMVSESISELFAKQPFENADKYGDLMVALRDNEIAYQTVKATGKGMKTILVRNKSLLEEISD